MEAASMSQRTIRKSVQRFSDKIMRKLEPYAYQRDVGRTGDQQPDREGELSAPAERMEARVHAESIRRF
jgi:hypothetical protein